VKEVKLVLSGNPKSTNNIYRAAARGSFVSYYMTEEGKALKTAYQWEAKAQWRGAPLQGELALSVRFYFGTKRKADLDNFNKLWQDALSGIVYNDDSQIGELHLYRDYDKTNPRIEVTVQ
jgi:Holliday junction resolvase RusA-like endonuclease